MLDKNKLMMQTEKLKWKSENFAYDSFSISAYNLRAYIEDQHLRVYFNQKMETFVSATTFHETNHNDPITN